mgnify:CR=1 FL=1
MSRFRRLFCRLRLHSWHWVDIAPAKETLEMMQKLGPVSFLPGVHAVCRYCNKPKHRPYTPSAFDKSVL